MNIMNRIKENKKGILGGMLALTIAGTGAFAYLTDIENETNTFTVGEVNIELTEPEWDEENGKDITPNKVIEKDPTVTNIGVNDAYIFVEVEIPYAVSVDVDTEIAGDDGTKTRVTDPELFTYTVNEGWAEVGTPVKDADREVVKHVYAYAKDNVMTAVAKGDSVTLFNSVKFINIVENYGLEKTTKEINVTAKAIQTSDINGGKTAPADVLEVINNQGPTNVKNPF